MEDKIWQNMEAFKMTYILAELASAHMGDHELCKALVHEASKAGADGVKLQVWQDSEIKDHPKYDNLKRFELTKTQWMDVVLEARQTPLEIWIEVIGEDSYRFAQTLRPDYWKIPFRLSWKIDNAHNIYWRYDKPIDLNRNVAIGEQHYPTDYSQALDELKLVKFHSKNNNVLYADHQEDLDGAIMISDLAAYKGAEVIEKHICLDREELKKESMDYISAIEPDEFKQFVEEIK